MVLSEAGVWLEEMTLQSLVPNSVVRTLLAASTKHSFEGDAAYLPSLLPASWRASKNSNSSLLILFLTSDPLDKNRHQDKEENEGKKGRLKPPLHYYLLGKLQRVYSCCAAASLAQKNYIAQSCKDVENQVY